ncbi:MAG: alpha/beta hydrolase [Pseudomonadota bacterium]
MDVLGEGNLDPGGTEQHVADVIVCSPGVSGHLSVMRPSSGESRAATLDSGPLADALAKHEVETTYVLELRDVSQQSTDQGIQSRAQDPEGNGIEIQVPGDGEGFGQVALVTDENGIASWHWPLASDGSTDTTRSDQTVTFVIPGYQPDARTDEGHRGVLGWFGKKVVRVLSFAIDPIIGRVGEFFAAKWEEKNRPYNLRSFTPDNYQDIVVDPLTSAEWSALNGPRSLLFVHGTFSRAGSAFSALPRDMIEELHRRYQGRVFAFDHKTLSVDPTENGRFFAENLPDGQSLDVDIVCHSRGGHVSRVLAERQSELPFANKSLSVNQVIFVASPNRGTILTDDKHMSDFVDSYTNVLSLLPDNAVTDILEVIVAVVKQLAAATLKGLDGLQSMRPDGTYLAGLNSGAAVNTTYRAISANFEPGEPSWKPWAKDYLMDQVFKEANDLVVPTHGVFEDNGDPMFPIADAERRLDIPASEGVHHGSFFGHADVQAALLRWLQPG